MRDRYFLAEPICADEVTLDGAEAHHLLHVLRAELGTQVTLFDGTGREFDAQVTACRRSSVELAIVECREIDRELKFPLTLGVALPKGDRQRWLIEKAVELGVTRLLPLRTARSVATSEKGGEKLDRYVVEASKQCGRNRLMEITSPVSWDEWLKAPADTQRVIADPTGQPLVASPGSIRPTFAAVGPEGGLTEAELAGARAASWEIVSLGPRILRIETAALALATRLSLGS